MCNQEMESFLEISFQENGKERFTSMSRNEYECILQNYEEKKEIFGISENCIILSEGINKPKQLEKIILSEEELIAKAKLLTIYSLEGYIIINSFCYRPNLDLYYKCLELSKHILCGYPILPLYEKELKIYKNKFVPADNSLFYYRNSESSISEEMVEFLAGGIDNIKSKPEWLIEILTNIRYKIVFIKTITGDREKCLSSEDLYSEGLSSEDLYSNVLIDKSLFEALYDGKESALPPEDEKIVVERLQNTSISF